MKYKEKISIIIIAFLVLVVLIVQLIILDTAKTTENDEAYTVIKTPEIISTSTQIPTAIMTLCPTQQPTPTILMTAVPEDISYISVDITYTPVDIENISIGGIRFMMDEQEVLDTLGEPNYSDAYYSVFAHDGWRTELYYNFGRITLFSEDVERTDAFVAEIFIYNESYSSPLNIVVGDSLEYVISRLNISEQLIENRQEDLYDESNEYGHVRYNVDGVNYIVLKVYDKESQEYIKLTYSFSEDVLTEISLYTDSY